MWNGQQADVENDKFCGLERSKANLDVDAAVGDIGLGCSRCIAVDEERLLSLVARMLFSSAFV